MANTNFCGCGNNYPIVPGTNPALQTWNGQAFIVADGSAQNRISLPFLQVNGGSATYVIGADNNGTLSYYNPAYGGTALNIFGGNTGSLPYQTAPNITTFLPIGTTGQVLKVSNTGLPVWSTPLAPTAQNISGGAAGEVVYQTATNTTGFTSVGTSGQVLTSGGTGSPAWTNQSALSVGNATNATTAVNFTGSLSGDVTGTQSSTSVVSVGGVTSTNVASGANAANAATDANTASTIVKRDASGNFSAGTITATLSGSSTSSTTATNIAGGLVNQIPYQTGAGATSFISAGTSLQVLLIPSGGGTPLFSGTTGTNGITVQKALYLSGGVAGAVPYQSAVGTTGFSAAGTTNQLFTSAGTGTPIWQTGYKGVTDGSNAASGFVGEWIASNVASGSAITLTTSGTVYQITSIALTAGDWDVSASINLHLSSTTMTTGRGGISTANNALTVPSTATTGVATNSYDTFASLVSTSTATSISTTLGLTGDLLLATKSSRVNLSGSVTLYLVATAAFTGTAPTAYGTIEARRVR
jgi:hypothetical protein